MEQLLELLTDIRDELRLLRVAQTQSDTDILPQLTAGRHSLEYARVRRDQLAELNVQTTEQGPRPA